MFLKRGAKNAGYTRVGARKKIKKAREKFPHGDACNKKRIAMFKKNETKKRKRKKQF